VVASMLVDKPRRFLRKLDTRFHERSVEIVMLANEPPNPSTSTGMATHERLTWDEICQRYPEEWVVMTEIAWVNDTDFEFGTALVLAHHKTRKEASPSVKAAFRQYDEVGSFWTGKIEGPVPRFIAP
jgi:hypothetical protein